MKLPGVFSQFLQHPPEKQVVYLSLVVGRSTVHVASWQFTPSRKPKIGHAVSERATQDSWEARLEACDRAIAKLSEHEGRNDFEKVVLGMPSYCLTDEDDIEHSIRGHIKKLTDELELTPIGFVPIHQSIVHMIQKDEGVPPSVVLVEDDGGESTLILYRVGVLLGKVKIADNDFVPGLERALKGFKDVEVLPSRILLYGGDRTAMEDKKRDLLKHPWPTRANFLHYPKIEILPPEALATAVSLAGASELATEVGESEEETFEKGEQDVQVVTAVEAKEADANMVEVTPETLGFRRGVDVLEQPVERKKEDKEEIVMKEERDEARLPSHTALMTLRSLTQFVSAIKLPAARGIAVPQIGVLILFIVLLFISGGGWAVYWMFPAARVTILQVPQIVTEVSSVTVNPTATVVDAATKTVPGSKQERTVSGDKTIAVTGKKDIGDPAKGPVTIYNKSLQERLFKKGAVLVAGSLQFTLDSDIKVASASESFTKREYGSANVSVTAAKLGQQGNLPADTEFTLKDVSTEVAIARNDKPFTGGTSKSVTVVSRADYDALVEALTKDLIVKAKAELAGAVGGGERLIDETVKTSVSQKKFDQELDQESDKLHGSITVAISGFSYNEDHIASLFADLVSSKVPSGYTLTQDRSKVAISNVQVKKDGSIVVGARYQGVALPIFDLTAIKNTLRGKSLPAAQDYLRSVPGVGGAEIDFSRTLWKEVLPVNAGNIALSVAVLE